MRYQHVLEGLRVRVVQPARGRYRRLVRKLGMGPQPPRAAVAVTMAVALGIDPVIAANQQREHGVEWNRLWLLGHNRARIDAAYGPASWVFDSKAMLVQFVELDPRTTQLPDPKYPHGFDVDESRNKRPACRVVLPYPHTTTGLYWGSCPCGKTFMISVNAAPDDPRSIVVACNTPRNLDNGD